MATPRVAIFVTARLDSQRLPRKALMSLCGRTVLDRVIERVRQARTTGSVVVCTTTRPVDDELAAEAERLGAIAFRGDPDDILLRWRDAARLFRLDFIVACDGDDVFCDPEYIDRVIDCHAKTRADYVTCEGLPFGAAPTGLSVSALERVCHLKREHMTEGQGRFFADPRVATHAEVVASDDVRHSDARMTLDYPEDAAFFEAVINELERPGRVFTLAEIVELLRRRRDIVELNSGLQDEYWRRFNERYPPVDLLHDTVE